MSTLFDFDIDAKQLILAVSALSKVANKRSNYNFVKSICLTAHMSGEVTLSATDTSFSVKIGLASQDIRTPGSCLIPVDKFLKDTDTIQRGSTPITLQMKSLTKVVLSCGSRKASIVTYPFTDDADIQFVTHNNGTSLNRKVLIDVIRSISHAASYDTTKPILSSVFLTVDDGVATAACLDGFRLSFVENIPITEQQSSSGTSFDLNIDVEKLETCLDIMDTFTNSSIVQVHDDGDHLWLWSDNIFAKMSPLAGNRPAWRNVVPQTTNTEILLDVSNLIGALNHASIQDVSNIVVLEATQAPNPTNSTLTVSSYDSEVGQNSDSLNVVFLGNTDTFRIILDASLIKPALKQMRKLDVNNVVLTYTGKNNPITLRPEGNVAYINVFFPMAEK